MAASNFSTVWTQLATPNSPVGSIPFVDTDGTSIVTDVLNFFYTAADGDTSGSKLPGSATVLAGIRVGHQDRTATPGSVTINKISGRVRIPAGVANITVTSDHCFSNSIVQLVLETVDATLVRVYPACYDGGFVLSGNAAATIAVNVAFIINNVAT